MCVYVLATRSVGRSENCFTRFLNWSWFLLTPLDSVGLVVSVCAWWCGCVSLCVIGLVCGALEDGIQKMTSDRNR